MRSTGDGTGSPARLPSKRVKRAAAAGGDHLGAERRAGVVGGGEVAAGRPAGRAAGAPARWPAPRAVAARRRTTPRAAPTARGPPRGRVPTTAPSPARWRAEVEHPARRDALDAAAQVAAGDAEELTLRARQGGEELVVLALDPVGPQGELAAGAGPLVVGQEGVVADGGGERALGQAEDHDEVEVEADAHLDRADEHAVAEATDAAEVLLELELERAVEHLEGDGLLDRVEGTEPVQRLVDALGRLALGRSSQPLAAGCAAEEAAEPALGPVGVLAPAPWSRGRGREVVDHLRARTGAGREPASASLRSRSGTHSGWSSSSSASAARSSLCSGVLAEAQVPVARGRRRRRPRGTAAPSWWWARGGRSWRIGADASHAKTSWRR